MRRASTCRLYRNDPTLHYHTLPYICPQERKRARSDNGVRYAFLCYVRGGAAVDLPPALAAQHEEQQVASAACRPPVLFMVTSMATCWSLGLGYEQRPAGLAAHREGQQVAATACVRTPLSVATGRLPVGSFSRAGASR